MDIPEIEGFKIIEKLGEGGMASVWKANQISLDRLVAIKILSPHLSIAAEDVERFQKEARSTAKLKHPGIVQVYDAKISNGLYCFIMEYIAGYTVGEWVRRKGHIGEVDTLTVADCVAEAMNYAWSTARLVHCDIKPDNIMIDADGTVKVADLGLSYTINAIKKGAKADEVMGTPAYISPEQAEGRLDLDCRSDIYSLGAMMYHMLTGKLMFHGKSDDKVMELQVTSEPEDAQKINPSIPDAVNNLLKKMLKKKRSERPQDWNAVRALLLDVRCRLTGNAEQGGSVTVLASLTGKSKSAGDIGSDTEKKPDKTNKGLLIGAGAAIVFLAFVFYIFTNGKKDDSQENRNADAVNPSPAIAATAVSNEDDNENESNVVDNSAATSNLVKQLSIEETARKMFEYADSRPHDTVEQMKNTIKAFEKVSEETAGTKYSLMAEDKIKYYQAVIAGKINEVKRGLDNKAKPYIESGDLISAADIYDLYRGALWRETAEYRKSRAEMLRKRHDEIEKKRQLAIRRKEEKFNKFYKHIPDVLLTDGLDAAIDMVNSGIDNPTFKNHKKELQYIYKILQDTKNIDLRIVDSFKNQIGQEIIISTIYGPKKLLVVSADKNGVIVRRNVKVGSGIASSDICLRYNEISQRERLSRMGDESEIPVLLAKGLMAVNIKSYDYALQFFSKLDEPFATGLTNALNKIIKEEKESNACDSLRVILSVSGVEMPSKFNAKIWSRLLNGLYVDEKDIDKVSKMLDEYIKKYGDTEFIERAMPVIVKLENILKRSEFKEENNSRKNNFNKKTFGGKNKH